MCVWAEELCLPLTVCLCEPREAGAESVGTGDGFRRDSLPCPPPTRPEPDSDPEKGFVRGADGKSGACVPGRGRDGGTGRWWWWWWLARSRLGYRKFCSGALRRRRPWCRRGRGWIEAEDQEEGWRGTELASLGKAESVPRGKGEVAEGKCHHRRRGSCISW